MSDNKVTLDQLDDSAVEAMSSSVGDVSVLNTENKTIVGAITEIVGKKEIANAIGEPLAETDKFTEMSSEINGLLSTFKTNMMNAGVVVESGDKFKALIDKIKGLTEGEGNKGVRFVSGHTTDVDFKTHTHTYTNSEGEEVTDSNKMFDIEIELDFDPSIILVASKFTLSTLGLPTDMESITVYDKLEKNKIAFGEYGSKNSSNFSNSYILPPLVEENKYYLPIAYPALATIQLSNITVNQCTWYAIGVGEEDTTLRDSLASILEEEGVEITEEDDTASLITKVDEEFDRKNGLLLGTLNIISATELPSTGVENQVCVITDNPVEKFIVSQFTEDMTDVGDAICLDLATNERSDNRLVMADNGRVKLYYYINRVVQSGNAKETYVYKNNQWVLLVEGLVYLLLDGVDMNNTTFGDIYIYNCTYTEIDDSTGEICLGTASQSTYTHKASCFSFANKINIDDYTKLTLRIKVSDIEWEPNIVVGLATSKAISGTSSTDSGYNNWSNTGVSFTSYCNGEVYTEIGSSYPENEYFTLEVDISEMTGTGYLCIGIEDGLSSYNWVRINTIGIQ